MYLSCALPFLSSIRPPSALFVPSRALQGDLMRWRCASPEWKIAFACREVAILLSAWALGSVVQEPIPGWPWQWLVLTGESKISHVLSLTNIVIKKSFCSLQLFSCLLNAVVVFDFHLQWRFWTPVDQLYVELSRLSSFSFCSQMRLGYWERQICTHTASSLQARSACVWTHLLWTHLQQAAAQSLEPKNCPLSPWSFHLPQESHQHRCFSLVQKNVCANDASWEETWRF